MILSLDISTSAIGVAVIDKGKVIHYHGIDLKKVKCFYEKMDFVKNYFLKDEDFKPYFKSIKEVRVEQFLQNFRRGFSSAATITKLAGFNTSIRYLMYVLFSVKPLMVNPVSGRKSLGINLDKEKDTKEQIMVWVEKNTKIILPTKTMKGGPNKGKTVRHPIANDIADAVVVGLIEDRSLFVED